MGILEFDHLSLFARLRWVLDSLLSSVAVAIVGAVSISLLTLL